MTAPEPWGLVLPVQIWMGSDLASDQPAGPGAGGVERWRDDLQLLAELGVKRIRVGVDWSRVVPVPDRAHHGWIEWYRSLASTAHECGLDIWWCLLERGIPGWFADEGGFGDRRATDRRWSRWIDIAAEHLGDLASGWVPLDDPADHARRAGRDDPRRMSESLHNVVMAWRNSWRVLRGPVPVATCLRVSRVRPVDHTVPALEQAREREHLMWRLWLRAWSTGVVDLPGHAGSEVPDLAGSLDVLGLWTNTADVNGASAVEDLILEILEKASDHHVNRPVHLTVRTGREGPDDAAETMAAVNSATMQAIDQGIPLSARWMAPGIAGPGAPDALLDIERRPLPVLEALGYERLR